MNDVLRNKSVDASSAKKMSEEELYKDITKKLVLSIMGVFKQIMEELLFKRIDLTQDHFMKDLKEKMISPEQVPNFAFSVIQGVSAELLDLIKSMGALPKTAGEGLQSFYGFLDTIMEQIKSLVTKDCAHLIIKQEDKQQFERFKKLQQEVQDDSNFDVYQESLNSIKQQLREMSFSPQLIDEALTNIEILDPQAAIEYCLLNQHKYT